MSKTGTIYGINGPVIYLAGNTGFKMSEMVYVGKEKLVGEVISLDKRPYDEFRYMKKHRFKTGRYRGSKREAYPSH